MVNVSEAGFWSSYAWEFSLAGLQRRAAKTEELAMIMTMIMVMVMTSLMMMTSMIMMLMMTMRGSPSLAGLQRRAAKTDGLMQNT